MSGDNWVAEAFRRRQAEELAKAARHQSPAGDRKDAAGREVLVDNWLVEGFQRHQKEERRREIGARSEEAEILAVGGDPSSAEAKPASMRALVATDDISLSMQGASADRQAGASDDVSPGAVGPLVSLGEAATVSKRGPRGAARIVAIAGVAVVGLVSVIGLKTALWSSVDSPRGFDRGAPSAAPTKKAARPAGKENAHPSQAAPSQGVETAKPPPDRPGANRGTPPSDSTARPADAAPAKPGDAAAIPAPPAEAPPNSMQNPTAAPRPQPAPEAPSSSAGHGDAAAPAASAPAPVPEGPKAAVSPAKPEKDSTGKPASVESERSPEGGGPGPGQNASEPKRHAPNANVDAKPKQQANEKNGVRHSTGKPGGFSGFLKRTANSVRRFFGRLGAQ